MSSDQVKAECLEELARLWVQLDQIKAETDREAFLLTDAQKYIQNAKQRVLQSMQVKV